MLILQQLFSLQKSLKDHSSKFTDQTCLGRPKCLASRDSLILLSLVLGAMYLGAQTEAAHHGEKGKCRIKRVHRWQYWLCVCWCGAQGKEGVWQHVTLSYCKVNCESYNIPTNVSFNCLSSGACICRWLLWCSKMSRLPDYSNHICWMLLLNERGFIYFNKGVPFMVSESTGNGLVMYMNVYSVCCCVVSELTSTSLSPVHAVLLAMVELGHKHQSIRLNASRSRSIPRLYSENCRALYYARLFLYCRSEALTIYAGHI